MAECSKCGKQEMTFTCRYCGEKFCSEHRLPEKHNCEKIDKVEKKSGNSSKKKWFKDKDPKRETIHGQHKQVKKPSIIQDAINTLKSNYTLAIIAVTVFSFALQLFSPDYSDLLILSPALTEAALQATNNAVIGQTLNHTLIEQPWSLVSVMLAHGSLFHIFANMITFYFFGTALERVIGGRELLKFYLAAGITASIGYIVFRNILFELYGPVVNSMPVLGPAVGASGAVVAVFAAVAILYPKAEVLLYFFIPMKIKTALYAFGAIEGVNLLAKSIGITLPVIGGFASSAHLVGLIAGVWFGRRLREEHRGDTGVLDLLGY